MTRREKKVTRRGKKVTRRGKIIRGPDFCVLATKVDDFGPKSVKFLVRKGLSFWVPIFPFWGWGGDYNLRMRRGICQIWGVGFCQKSEVRQLTPPKLPRPKPVKAYAARRLARFPLSSKRGGGKTSKSEARVPPPSISKQYIYIYIDEGGTLASSGWFLYLSPPRPSFL